MREDVLLRLQKMSRESHPRPKRKRRYIPHRPKQKIKTIDWNKIAEYAKLKL